MSDSEDEALLQQLSPEQLKELSEDIDPEGSMMPAAFRQPNQTEKESTGPYDRQHLIEYMKEEATRYEDDEEIVPYQQGVRRGKPFIKKEESKPIVHEYLDLSDDLLQALDNATEAEIADLASLIGVHSIVFQADDEFSSDDEEKKERRKKGIIKGSVPRVKVEDEPDNDTDINDTIERLNANEGSLKVVNLNNHKEIDDAGLTAVVKALKNNTSLRTLSLANTKMRDQVATALGDALAENSTLEELNLESNYITAVGLSAIVSVLATNQTLRCLKLSNQSQSCGVKSEEEVAKVLERNQTLLNFGLSFVSPGPRERVHRYLLRNRDLARIKRVSSEQD